MGLTWGVDPGPDRGAVVALTPEGKVHLAAELSMSSALDLPLGPGKPSDQWAIEWLGSYGAPPSQGLFRTALWVGRLVEAWTRQGVAQVELWQRRTIKRQLLGKVTGGDPQVREALCEALGRIGAPGGGKTPAVGTRRAPGPLYGLTGHSWAALAVAYVAQTAATSGLLPDELARRGALEINPMRR